ncbi:neuronal acetylcholine receptor subunit beta-4-like isoform X2 [Artemia franciscana]|uniref:Uncharacterized protein n=1 Tax=Artemia franciscana TaxID=6661 RepID=A0AA88I1W7_ARTSF|nr:hypothetical protein QYM36_005814 [Artemia franciscana]
MITETNMLRTFGFISVLMLGISLGNAYTDLRRGMTKKSVAAVKTPDVLSSSEYRGFWISFKNGEIEVGREYESMPFLHWKDKDPIHIHYFSFATWTDVIGKWLHSCEGDGEMQGDQPLSPLEYFNAEHKLQNDLMKGYSSQIRPLSNHNESLTVEMGLVVFYMDLRENESVFNVNGFLQIHWKDKRLAWNESHYEGLNILHIPSELIWKPQISLANSIDHTMNYMNAATHVTIMPGGVVLMIVPASFHALCEIDLRNYPWDTQKCSLIFYSYFNGGDRIDINLLYDTNPEYSLTTYKLIKNNQWHAVIDKAERVLTPDEMNYKEYPEIYFTFELKRKSPLFISTLFLPAIVTMIVCLLSLWMPPNCPEKMYMIISNMVVLFMYLAYLNYILPTNLEHQPTVVSFYGGTLLLVTISLLFTVITIRMTRLPKPTGMPYCLKKVIIGPIGTLLGLNWTGILISPTHKPLETLNGIATSFEHSQSSRHNEISSHQPDLEQFVVDSSSTGANMEWMVFALFIDRILFICYSFLFGILLSICF